MALIFIPEMISDGILSLLGWLLKTAPVILMSIVGVVSGFMSKKRKFYNYIMIVIGFVGFLGGLLSLGLFGLGPWSVFVYLSLLYGFLIGGPMFIWIGFKNLLRG